jgi:hypothetical protein
VLIETWTEDFENDETLGIMQETYEGLKQKSAFLLKFKFAGLAEPYICMLIRL